MSKPSRPSRPVLCAPITLHEFEALDRAHADVVLHLKQLEQLVDHLEREGVDERARTLAAAVCRFFEGTARAHHEDEERVVFPPLLGSPGQ
jgi:hypothetical protein